MSQAELARRTGLTPKHINQVMQGTASISADVAQRLALVTGTSASWWTRLEADYRSEQARLAQIGFLSDAADWVRALPVAELVRSGHLPETANSIGERALQLLAFFRVATVNAFESMWDQPLAAFRQSRAYDIDRYAVAAWLRIGEIEAERIAATEFSARKLRASLPRLRRLTAKETSDVVADITALGAEAGLRIVFIPEIKGARAYGVTRWLSATEPVIQLSLRGKTRNRMWETLFHEIGHVLLHERKAMFVETDDDVTVGAEEQAETFSKDQLIPPTATDRLWSLRTVDDAIEFSKEIGVGADIVISRAQAEGIFTRSQGSTLLRPLFLQEDESEQPRKNGRLQRRTRDDDNG
ncbi:hypothetical protein ASE16_02005 [Leifsonia sp. Root227]|nr:hypothetical protein ASE16_02005 [Leifsonia sp. Root227]